MAGVKITSCDICLKVGSQVTAVMFCGDCSETLCQACVTHHGKFKFLAGHTLWNVSDPKFDMDVIYLSQQLIKCYKHPSKDVEYICKDHDRVCCTECSIVSHRTCRNLVSLTDECGNRTDHTKTLLSSLKKIENNAKCIKAFEKSKQAKVTRSKRELKEKLASVKREFEEAYKSLERQITAEIDRNSSSIIAKSNYTTSTMEPTLLKCKSIQYTVESISTLQNPILDYLLAFKLQGELDTLKKGSYINDKIAFQEDLKLRENYSVKKLCQNIATCMYVSVATSKANLDFDPALSSDFVTDNTETTKRCRLYNKSGCTHSFCK